jgi:mycobactin peptide synthetase MbtE
MLLEQFDARVTQTPDAVAVVDDRSSRTYAQLDSESRAHAQRLIALGVGLEDVVTVVSERGSEYVALMLGVLRAGAAFLPVEPSTPQARARLMCRTAGVRAVLAQPGHEGYADDLAADLGVPLVQPVSTLDKDAVFPTRLSAGLAYVIFTSGSTGTPKGAMVTDAGMDNHLASKVEFLSLGPDDVVGFTAPLGFDISVWQVLTALVVGGRVGVAPAGLSEPIELVAWAARHAVTVLELVPSFLTVMLDLVPEEELRAGLASVRYLIATGEALPLELARRWFRCCPEIALVNAYGPTECADDVIHHLITEEECHTRDRIPIGREIPNIDVYIVDDQARVTGAGLAGTLLVGGRGVGRGYINDPARTALAFVPDHLSGRAGERLYRTGDRGIRDRDGIVDYLGRGDRQVKVRGHRVELGDVEAQLLRVPGVIAAACVLTGDRLRAFVTLRAEQPPPTRTILAAVRQSAPAYLVPHEVAVLERLPTGRSGKVDLRALEQLPTEPDGDYGRLASVADGHHGRLASVADGERPAAASDRLAEAQAMFAEVLGVAVADGEDDLFRSGADSLQAMRLMGLARARFNRPGASLRGFLSDPTPRGLLAALDADEDPAAAGPPIDVEPGALSSGQERLWFLEQLHPRRGAQLLRLVLTLRGPLDRTALQQALDAVVMRHEPLRTVFSQRVGVPVGQVWPQARIELHLVPPGAAEVPDLLNESGLSVRTERPPLAAAQLVDVGPNHHVLTVVLHHLVADGWSLAVLGEEISTHYDRFRDGKAAAVAELPASYTDYVAEERRWLVGPEAAACERYWRGQLAGAPPSIDLPFDRPRPDRQTFVAASAVHELSADDTAALLDVARALGATPFMAVMAALYLTLRELTGASDMVLGLDAANRSWIGSDHLIGTFVNQLPLRLSCVDSKPAFHDVLALAREQCLGAYEHERLPFHKIVAAVNPPRRAGRPPLFQVKVTQQGGWRSSLDLPTIQVTPAVIPEPVTHLDLVLEVSGELDRLRLELLYPTEMLDRPTATAWVEAIADVLRAGTAPGPTHMTPTETLVAAVWRDVLQLDEVSTRDNFFEVGGHSLVAVQVLHELGARTGVELDLETFFDLETLGEVAAQLDRRRGETWLPGETPDPSLSYGYEGEL